MKTKEEILENRRNSPKFSTNQQFSKDQIILAMEEYADQFKTKWVSIEERLPEYGQSVYTYSPAQEDTNECQRIITCGTLKAGFPCGVTHWMPMPEPPNT